MDYSYRQYPIMSKCSRVVQLLFYSPPADQTKNAALSTATHKEEVWGMSLPQ